MRASEILRRYAAGERNFQRMNLRGLSFKEENLSGADFSEADIRGTNFSGANLTGAKFQGAKAGLQKRGVLNLLAISWLVAALSGFCLLYAGNLVAFIFDSNQKNMIAGWASLGVIILFGAISIRRGIAIVGIIVAFVMSVGAAVALAFSFMGSVAFSLAVSAAVSFGVILVLAIVISGAVAIAGIIGEAITISGVIAGAIAFIFTGVIGDIKALVCAVVIGSFLIILGMYLSWRAMKGDWRDAWIYHNAVIFAIIEGTNFCKANLTDADFSKATLKNTDFREAILIHTCWRDADRLDLIRATATILQYRPIRELLQTGNGYDKSFFKADLRGANLQGVNLENANLKQADLSEAILRDANLKNINLSETLAIGTDFTGAYLTGACLEAWNIDPSTNLDCVDCQYVFLLEYPNTNGSRERRPHHPDKTFEPGDFEKLYQQLMNTVQLLLKNGINPEAFREAFQQIMAENSAITWDSIQKAERKGNDVLVEVTVPPNTDKAKIERTFETTYQDKIFKLEAKIDELQTLQHQDMKDIALALATHPQITQTMNNNPQTNKGIFLDNTTGDVNISNSANIDNINSTITNQISELPTTSEPEKLGIKELLEQLQTAINTDNNLNEKNKSKALKQVQNLAEAGKDPKNNTMKDMADDAMTMLKGIIAGLPAAAKLAETCEKIIPAISAIFGL